MGTPPPAPLSVTRKSYQTDCRPLADVVFCVAISAALMCILYFLSGTETPLIMTTAVASVFCGALYALLTNLLTIFRMSVPTALVSVLIVFVLSLLMVKREPDGDMTTLMAYMPLMTIAVSKVVAEGFRRMREGQLSPKTERE